MSSDPSHTFNPERCRGQTSDLGHSDRIRCGRGPGRHRLGTSLSHPGGNVTGLSLQSNDLAGKRLQLMREVIPNLHRVAFLGGSDNPITSTEVAEFQTAAQTLGLEIIRPDITQAGDIAPVI